MRAGGKRFLRLRKLTRSISSNMSSFGNKERFFKNRLNYQRSGLRLPQRRCGSLNGN